MQDNYYKERLHAQEEEIARMQATIERARLRGDKKLLGISRKRLDVAIRLREMYQRLLVREGVSVG
jgi:hypothetical protein